MAFNVLIVDDSAVMRGMIARVVRLSGLPLGALYEAGDGAAGLGRARAHWVDLVLLDVNMPVMDGEEMLRRLRAAPETGRLPVIVVSTEGSEARRAALEALGVSFIRKPFKPRSCAHVVLQRPASPPTTSTMPGVPPPELLLTRTARSTFLSRSRSLYAEPAAGAPARGARRPAPWPRA
jgi:two-component system chemotaxis response regulator CheY